MAVISAQAHDARAWPSIAKQAGRADPRKIPGLVAWYDARYLDLPDGTPFNRMADLTGRGLDLVNNTGATSKYPLFKSTSASYLKPSVYLDGVDDYLLAYANFGNLFGSDGNTTLIVRAVVTNTPTNAWPTVFGGNTHKTFGARIGSSTALKAHFEIGRPPFDGSAWDGVSIANGQSGYPINIGTPFIEAGRFRLSDNMFRVAVWHDDGRSGEGGWIVNHGTSSPNINDNIGLPAAGWGNNTPLEFQWALWYNRYLSNEELEYLRNV